MSAEAMTALRKSKEIASEIKKQLKERDGAEYDTLKSQTKVVLDSIGQLMDELVGPESDLQGIVSYPDPNIMSYLRVVNRYLRSSLSAPGATENQLKNNAEVKLNPWLTDVNDFFETSWKLYQQQVNAVDLSPFQEVDEFKLE